MNGRGEPDGQSVIWSIELPFTGTSVTFKAYALAFDGKPHPLDGIGTVREVPPPKKGAPNAPVFPDPTLVSITRHGVTAVKRKLVASSWAFASGTDAITIHASNTPARTLGCMQNALEIFGVRVQSGVITASMLHRTGGGVKRNLDEIRKSCAIFKN